MADRPIFTTGSVKNGRLKVRHTERIEYELRRWAKKDREVVITIEPLYATRSPQANNYYWGVVLDHIFEHSGNTPNELHEYFKRRFLSKPIILCNRDGVIIGEDTVGQSTTKQNVVTFYDYVENIRVVAGEMGIVIPDPDPDYWEK